MGADERTAPVWIDCACYGEGVRLTYDSDYNDGCFYLSMWRTWRGSVLWRQRFRHIWRILRCGEPYEDEVTLELAEARKLAAAILAPGAGPVVVGDSVMTFTASSPLPYEGDKP